MIEVLNRMVTNMPLNPVCTTCVTADCLKLDMAARSDDQATSEQAEDFTFHITSDCESCWQRQGSC
jgi:hypothetical protein